MKSDDELKKLARSAKSRMTSGYWQGAKTFVSPTAKEEGTLGYAIEEEMYAKVREMLFEDECVIDPIGRLMDKRVYAKLSSTARTRYVLELSKIYVRLKERFYREKERNGVR